METGLKTTLNVLAATPNEAAVRVLVPALDDCDQSLRDGALNALLSRRSTLGLREVVRRLDRCADAWRSIIAQKPGRLSSALRDSIQSSDETLCTNACRAAVWFHEYDLVPTLLGAIQDNGNPLRAIASRTLLELVEELYHELASPRDYTNKRDPQLVRRHVTASLEQALGRFGQHKRVEVLEAFLLLAARDNAALRQMLMDSQQPAHPKAIELLHQSQRPGVVRLLLNFLDDPYPPLAALHVLSRRSDPKFLTHLLNRVGYEPSALTTQNLRRMEGMPWLTGDLAPLANFDDGCQHAAVQVAVHASLKRQDVFRVLEWMLEHGKPGGRRAAAAALADFKGPEANELAAKALEDQDPYVQAHVLRQIRARGIPGAMTRLVAMIDSPEPAIQEALRETMVEFTFDRYVAQYDAMQDDVRRGTGQLVRKLDPRCVSHLNDELYSPNRQRRERALSLALSLDLVREVEPAVIHLLRDDDHMIRLEAARTLAESDSPSTREALSTALADPHDLVQEEARRLLARFNEKSHEDEGAADSVSSPPVEETVS